MSQSLTITAGEKSVMLEIPRNVLSEAKLKRFLDFVRLEFIAQQSQLTEEGANEIADKLTDSWWSENRDRFVGQFEPGNG